MSFYTAKLSIQIQTYLVARHSVPLIVIFKFEHLIVVNLPDCRWVIEKLHLDFGSHRLFLLVSVSTHLERLDHL